MSPEIQYSAPAGPVMAESAPPADAVVYTIFAFLSWILCLPPLVWHFSQRNIAAWSLILWCMLGNFLNSINALIWPGADVHQWWDGNVFCDIQARLWVGHSVALSACVAMILRKLANVMDTRNITVTTSRGSLLREKVFEGLICWGFPALLMLVYYIVQPVRYIIYQIAGCGPAFDASWVSVVLSLMWGPITICFASYFAGLLVYRLYQYRREFSRLLSARNTTKSRFIRLCAMSLIIVIVYLPFNFYVLWWNCKQIDETFDYDRVHGSTWNTAIEVPMGGVVRFDKWAEVATGYLAFIVFGTGSDACTTYKRMLCVIGLGKIFPSLNEVSQSGTSSPASVRLARSWASTCAGKAKSFFSKNTSVTETTLNTCAMNGSLAVTTEPTTPRSMSLQCHTLSTNDPILQQATTQPHTTPGDENSSLFARVLRRSRKQSILPIFAPKSAIDASQSEKSPIDPHSTGVYAHAWASDSHTATGHSDGDGVHVRHEVWQEHRESAGKDLSKDIMGADRC